MNPSPSHAASHRSKNPFLDDAVAARYEEWYTGEGGRADRLEKRLLHRQLHELPTVRTILEVGCGTGHFARWLRKSGYEVTGLDSSPAMLAQARNLNGGAYVQGDAESLPFPDRSFDVTAFITTLEFIEQPARALSEASRVTRQALLLGVLNRTSLLARSYRRSANPLWKAATFYSPSELAALVGKSIGRRVQGIHWRTTLWPFPLNGSLPLPWGGFIGMCVRLCDYFN